MTHRWITLLGTCCAISLVTASAGGQARRGQPGPPGQGNPPMGMPGMPPMFPNPAPIDPVLGKLTMEIMALRQIHDGRFTSADIAAALKALKEMNVSEKALHERTEATLKEERSALLAAGPDTETLPRGVGEMNDAAQAHRAKVDRLWNGLIEAIGEKKVDRLQSLLGHGGPMGGPGMMPGGGDRPPMGGPGMMPGGGDRPPMGEPGMRLGGGSLEWHEDLVQDPLSGPGNPGFAQGGAVPPLQGPGRPPMQGPGRMQQRPFPGMGARLGVMQFGPRITLAELIDLLEQKLAAMRK